MTEWWQWLLTLGLGTVAAVALTVLLSVWALQGV
jgi:hypothetical protein